MFCLFVVFGSSIFCIATVFTQSHKCPDNRPPVDTCLDQCPTGHVCMEGICCPTCSTINSNAGNGTNGGSQIYVPQCDSSGNYLAEQCDSAAGVCFCVTELGKEIAGTRLSRADSDGRQRPCPMERTFRLADDRAAAATPSTSGGGGGLGTGVSTAVVRKPAVVARCASDQGGRACVQQCFEPKDCSVLDDSVEWSCCWNGCATRCEAIHGKLGFSDDRTTPALDNDARFIKPGSCPISVPAFDVWSSLENCSVDDNCVGNKKCCSSPYGKKCLSPLQQQQQQQIIQPIRGLDSKPGVCPSPIGVLGSATLACSKDKDCPGNWKCCEDVGGLFCRSSLPEPDQFNPSLNQPIWPARITAASFDQSCRDLNEEFQNCGTPCPPSCQDRSQPQWCLTAGCVPGCFCRKAYIRRTKEFGASCVPENQCPIIISASDNVVSSIPQFVESRAGECPTSRLHPVVSQAITTRHVPPCTIDQSCPVGQKCCQVPQPLTFLQQRFCLCTDANAIWSDCGPACADTCSGGQIIKDNCRSSGQQCRPGCVCLPGYIQVADRDNSGRCIRRHLCTVNSTGPFFNNDSQQLVSNKLANIKFQGTSAHPLVNGSADLEQVLLTKTILSGQIQGLKPGATYFLELRENGNISGDFCQSTGDVMASTQAQQPVLFDWQTVRPVVNSSTETVGIQTGQKVVSYATSSFVSDPDGKAYFSLAIDGNLNLVSDFFSNDESQTLISRSLTLSEKPSDQQVSQNNNSTEIIACGVIGFVQNQ